MSIQTKNLVLIPHEPTHLVALFENEITYENASGMRLAEGLREFLLAGTPEFGAQLQSATTPDPLAVWFRRRA